jgi:dTDP-4-amino-4,6-dideoxygalactose transaminase
VVLDDAVNRDRLRRALSEAGIQTSIHYPPAHRLSLYREGATRLPVTDAYADRCLTLPLFPHMTEAQQDLVVESLSASLRKLSHGARSR